MEPQHNATFGEGLRQALRTARKNQADLARDLGIDPGQVSRWATDKAVPHAQTVAQIEELLATDLSEFFAASKPMYELYVSAPITGLAPSNIRSHHDAVAQVVSAARAEVNDLYWPGESVNGPKDLVAADIATERNLKVLAGCSALLYVQMDEIVSPSGALIELGLALGRKTKTTIVLRRGLKVPYMMDGFAAVAAGLQFLPQARVYEVASAEAAATLVSRNGRELLGLA